MLMQYKFHKIIFLSIMQGLTEFLPISSTAHIIILSKLFHISCNNFFKLFITVIQLGSIIATCIFYRTNIIDIFKNTLEYNIILKKKFNLIHIIIVTSPIVICGLLLYKYIKHITNIKNVIYGLLIGSILICIAEIFKPKNNIICSFNKINYQKLYIIGLIQCLSLIPGFSRSGSVLSINLILGIKRTLATKLCFIMAIPVILGASCLDLYKNYALLNINNILLLCESLFLSFITSLLTIKISLFLINNISWLYFVIYRLIILLIIYINYI
ncbi:undecaprenyl-diphosphatase [Enterobacteriaceae endosymbiont of Macroplea mutica]|uniref:undecaprenyl-diphosphate phosphatase n=1 Tax=Enterobacteriaceae endosymbiont of Macroplea mutica TaxID=2675791 RepID=UPI0014499878|nr:undecaprenyl-diphosphate phosphatase [Enterobacteriaceae endosymbiont of Macroplea mutica]QJC31264.1 undecaprenyl-diphosphatase [Enterobacteriaceae endosymbiont of Macroplea mutica]